MRTSASNSGRGLKISLAICSPSNNQSWRDDVASPRPKHNYRALYCLVSYAKGIAKFHFEFLPMYLLLPFQFIVVFFENIVGCIEVFIIPSSFSMFSGITTSHFHHCDSLRAERNSILNNRMHI